MEISLEVGKDYSTIPQVVIRCRKENEEVKEIIRLLETKDKKLMGSLHQEEHVIEPKEVLYAESVDGITYLYTRNEVYRNSYSLTELEEMFAPRGYFRCSKSVVLNIHAIKTLKSEIGNRIDACLENGEHIIISRRYAKQLRAILKGGEKE